MSHASALLAAVTKINPTEIGYDNPVTNADTAFGNMLNLVYIWAGILAVIVIIIAGYLFITARGNPDQVKRGKDAVRGAVIGLVVIMLAFVITQFVLGRL
jgi:cytochrome bd-type quinol oxidase subunit 2